MPPIQFEWDPIKNAANYIKHGIPFAAAKDVFADPNWILYPSKQVDNEERSTIVGKYGSRIIAVIYTHRPGKIRIISARATRRKERQQYGSPHHG